MQPLKPKDQKLKGLLSRNNLRKIAIVSLFISLNMCSRCSKEPSHRGDSFFSTHNICFG